MVSHYRIIEKIGAGGVGEVYLTEDTECGGGLVSIVCEMGVSAVTPGILACIS